ncbi:MAG TPA: MFS transporter [Promineifilum sp.]|nr:MFS transporter [Promineifilum sp.]
MSQTENVASSQPPWVWDARRIGLMSILIFSRFLHSSLVRIAYPFAPAFARGLGVPIATIYLLISARNLISLLSPLFASLPERFGYRNIMSLAMLLLSALCLLVAGVPAFWSLAIALVAAGIVKVIFDPTMQAYLGDVVPYAQRGKAISMTEFGWSASFLIGAPFIGWLIARQGWPAPFLWLGLAAIPTTVLLRRGLPPTNRAANHEAVSLRYIWQTLRRHPIIWASSLYMMLTLAAQEGLFIVYGDWMESTFNLSLTSLGLATTLIGLAEMSGEATAGWSVDRFGKRPVTILCGLLTVVIFLIIPLSAGSLVTAMAAMVAMFFTFEIAVVGAIPLLTELVPGARTVVMSMSLGSMAAGRAIGSLIGPIAWAKLGIAGNSIIAAVVMLLAVLVLARWLHEGKGEIQ